MQRIAEDAGRHVANGLLCCLNLPVGEARKLAACLAQQLLNAQQALAKEFGKLDVPVMPGNMGRGGKPPGIIGGLSCGGRANPGGRICGGASCGGPWAGGGSCGACGLGGITGGGGSD